MTNGTLWAELLAYGSGIALSPLHIGLLLLLLLGPNPLRRGGLLVMGWMLTVSAMLVLLLTVGHGLLLTMEKGSSHRTGLDLLAAGVLLALGLKELLDRREEGEEAPGWTRQLDRLCAMPLPLLLGVSSALEVVSPDDLFLFAKTASALLAAGLTRLQETLYTGAFTLASSTALLLPFLAVLIGREQVLPLLERGKTLLFNKGDLLVGGLSLVLAGYLGWQGIEGLQLS
ncbi:GAP family protein [Synechococcus sp. LTW-R]|uniref:GAP family protein n=1 Tax=Synechococcus sp. LTW-R TaxID=2751170 RepID=UPI001625F00A|nr:GAP family protein [Synechococcus sp. LTW-R]QNG30629.1 GAP family protein [Synechococcus sp. LTW-R]